MEGKTENSLLDTGQQVENIASAKSSDGRETCSEQSSSTASGSSFEWSEEAIEKNERGLGGRSSNLFNK